MRHPEDQKFARRECEAYLWALYGRHSLEALKFFVCVSVAECVTDWLYAKACD